MKQLIVTDIYNRAYDKGEAYSNNKYRRSNIIKIGGDLT
jgi:hypothetical protein